MFLFSPRRIFPKKREREGEKRATIVLKIFSTDKRTNTEHIPPVITFLCKQQLRYAHALIGRNSSGRNTSCKHKRRTCTIDSCPWKITRSKFAFSFPRKVCYETTRLWSTDSTAKWVRHLNSSPNFIQTLENDSFVLFNRRGNLSFVRVISIWPEEETNCEQRRGFRRGFVWFVAFDRSTRDGVDETSSWTCTFRAVRPTNVVVQRGASSFFRGANIIPCVLADDQACSEHIIRTKEPMPRLPDVSLAIHSTRRDAQTPGISTLLL